jgi:colicin import membrane protein
MKAGTTISTLGHGIMLAWCLVSFSARPFDIAPVESINADVISEKDFSQLTAGSKTAPQIAKAQPVADKIGPRSEPVKDVLAKPVDKPPVQMAEAALPPPPAPPPPAKPIAPEPKPPQAKPPPPAASDSKADVNKPEPDPIAEALKREEAKRKDEAKKAEDAKRREEEAKKVEEAKRREEVRKREEAKKREENKFDPAKIETALLDKRAPQRQVVTGSLVNPTAMLGAAAANAPELSQSEIDALRAQLMSCWNPPVGVADAKNLIVVVRFALNRDGSVAGDPLVVNRDANGLFQIAAESATRAVRRCQPFRLPAAKYEAWREVEVKFDPNDLFRG